MALRRPRATAGGELELSAEITGGKEISAAIRKMGSDKDLVRVLRAANKSVAEIVAREARRRVPVRTGALRKTIRSLGARTSSSVKAGGGRGKVRYAWMVHAGYRPGGGTTKVEGRPYLSDAVKAKWPEILAQYESAMDVVVDAFNRKYGYTPREAIRMGGRRN